MNSLEELFKGPPPSKIKVYAPNGDTKETVARLGIRVSPQYSQLTELFLEYEDGTIDILSKKVVVKDLETGAICYNPRTAPRYFCGVVFLSGSEMLWLQKNRHWPAVLELWDNPVEDKGKEDDGLFNGG